MRGGGEAVPLPLGVKVLAGVNLFFYMLEVVFPKTAYTLALNPDHFASSGGDCWPALFLSSLIHTPPFGVMGLIGMTHIVMNMFTLWMIGPFLENKMGTIAYLGFTASMVMLVGPLILPLAGFLKGFGEWLDFYHTNNLGFSGVLFAQFVLYLKLTPGDTVSILAHDVPKWMLPLANMGLLSFFFTASLAGHLSGFILGVVYAAGIPGCFDQRQRVLRQIEEHDVLTKTTARDDFVPAKPEGVIREFSRPFGGPPTTDYQPLLNIGAQGISKVPEASPDMELLDGTANEG